MFDISLAKRKFDLGLNSFNSYVGHYTPKASKSMSYLFNRYEDLILDIGGDYDFTLSYGDIYIVRSGIKNNISSLIDFRNSKNYSINRSIANFYSLFFEKFDQTLSDRLENNLGLEVYLKRDFSFGFKTKD